MDLPLFPLHTVLCPGVALPLHVFEPRYRRMIQRCILAESGFGVILIREGHEVGEAPEALASVGTVADLREANRYADGRYDILTVGTQRFRLDDVALGDDGYLLGSVTMLDEPVGDPVRARALAARAGRQFIRYLELLRPGENEPAGAGGLEIRIEVVSGDEPDDDEPDDDEPGDPEEPNDAHEAGDPSEPAELERQAASEGPIGPGQPGSPGDPGGPDVRAAFQAVDAGSRGPGGLAGGDGGALEAARRLMIPDDPVSLSYLLGGIVQVELAHRQRLLEAETAEARLAALSRLLDRELLFLGRRLRMFEADPKLVAIRLN